MTDTTTLDGDAGLRGGAPRARRPSERLGSDGTAVRHAAQDAGAAPVPPARSCRSPIVAVLVLNISRVFLAGDKDAALVMRHHHHARRSWAARRIIAAAPRLQHVVAGADPRCGCSSWCRWPASSRSGRASTTARAAPTPVRAAAPAPPAPRWRCRPRPRSSSTPPNYTAPAGIVQINYGGATGHTLAIHDPKFAGFLLTTDAGGAEVGQGRAHPGQVHDLLHRRRATRPQGMKATITVSG